MATPLQQAVSEPLILPAKPQVQIETSSSRGSASSKQSSKPKSKKNLSKSLSRSSLDDGSSKGTVLLRQPLPKYSFLATKKKTESLGDLMNMSSSAKTDQQFPGSESTLSLNKENITSPELGSMALPAQIQMSSHLPTNVGSKSGVQTLPKQRPVSKVDPVQSTKLNLETAITDNSQTINKSDLNLQTSVVFNPIPGTVNNMQVKSKWSASDNMTDHMSPQPLCTAVSTSLESLPFPDISAADISAGVAQSLIGSASFITGMDQTKHYKEEAERLKLEVKNLRKQLEVQFQVNAELKKLLIASVGDDLQFRVENLARDKAQLSSEIGTFAKRRTEDYEHIDKISIQADMWRSKFLASRVMVDELASAKAFLSMQCQESQSVLQEVLTERHELRANLLETYKTMQQVKSAFDPLNAQKTLGLPSTNSLDLARMNQRLAEQIRYRLLPSHIALDTVVNMDSWIDNLTLAESRAHEFLSKKINPDDVRHHIPSSLRDPGDIIIDRFHPYTRFDNLTLNCCVRCQGEMFAL